MTNTPPPAPPPIDMSPNDNIQSRYDFFLKDHPKPKRGLMTGGSFKKNLFIVLGGAFTLLIIVIVFVSLVLGGNGNINQQLLELAQEQTEIVRVADIGIAKSRGTDAKNLATTTKYSISSSLIQVLSLIKKKAGDKSLNLKKDAQTDQILESAATNNNFDEVFVQTIMSSLKTYQTNTKKIFDRTKNAKTRQVMTEAYNGVNVLLGIKQTQSN